MVFTDDADRANFIGSYAETFDADPDPWFDDDAAPKCGGSRMEEWGRVGCPGCRHCFAPDFEAIHTGFEAWDRPDFDRVRNELWVLAGMGYALSPHPIDCPAGRACFERMIGFNARLLRAAEYKLARICERRETHPEAVAEYEAWAAMVRAKLAERTGRATVATTPVVVRKAA